jgi:hypothetical protein
MQSSDQCDGAEFTALAAEERAENSEVLEFQRERIRTLRRSGSYRHEERSLLCCLSIWVDPLSGTKLKAQSRLAWLANFSGTTAR